MNPNFSNKTFINMVDVNCISILVHTTMFLLILNPLPSSCAMSTEAKAGFLRRTL